MMAWNNVRDAFDENPYRVIANGLGWLALAGLIWALTPWFPIELGLWP